MVAHGRRDAHINAARQRVGRKAHLKVELVDSFLETPVTAKNNLIFEESG